MRSQSLLLAIYYACLAQLALAWTAASLPDPQKNFEKCGRSVRSWVCSPDGLVDDHTLDVVQGHINAIHDGTDPYSTLFCPTTGKDVPVEVLATVVGRVDGSGETSQRVKRFATGVHDRFGVGSKECGSGVVIAVSVEDRQVYISTGALVERNLPATRIAALVNGVKPELRAGKYGKALEKLVVEVGLVLASDCERSGTCADAEADSGPWWVKVLAVGGMGSIIGFVFWKNRRDAQQQREVSSKLRKLQKDLKASKQGKYISTSCPICLQDFSPSDDGSPAAPSSAPTSRGQSSELTSLKPPADYPAPSAPTAPQPPHESSEQAPLLSGQHASSSATSAAAMKAAQAGYLPAMKAGTSTESEAEQPRLPFMLPCGHSFCEACIMEWLKKKPECPVCRKPATGEGAAGTSHTTTGAGAGPGQPHTDPGASTSQHSQQGARPPFLRLRPPRHSRARYSCGLGYDGFGPELAFRLHRLRNRHRGYLSQEVVDDLLWEANGGVGQRPGSRRGGRSGPVEDWGSHPEFLRQMDEAMRASRASQGARGSGGRSFGGGRSSGGGGGGW